MDTVALKRKTNFKESSKEKTKQKCGKKVKIQKLTNNQQNKEHITCLPSFAFSPQVFNESFLSKWVGVHLKSHVVQTSNYKMKNLILLLLSTFLDKHNEMKLFFSGFFLFFSFFFSFQVTWKSHLHLHKEQSWFWVIRFFVWLSFHLSRHHRKVEPTRSGISIRCYKHPHSFVQVSSGARIEEKGCFPSNAQNLLIASQLQKSGPINKTIWKNEKTTLMSVECS